MEKGFLMRRHHFVILNEFHSIDVFKVSDVPV